MNAHLEVRNVSVSFGGLRAIDEVSLTVQENAIVGIIGPNGAGKTTLFNVICGLQDVDKGEVLLRGSDISGAPPFERARMGFGRTFQNVAVMMDQSVYTNVLAGQYLGSAYRSWDLLVRPWRWLQSEDRLAQRTIGLLRQFGLENLSDVPATDLSFATARFVEVVGVLARSPTLMLLDEPTTGLDLAEAQVLLTALHQSRDQGMTVLVISHDVSFVMNACDVIHVMAQGRMLAEGRPEEIRRNPAVQFAYLGGD